MNDKELDYHQGYALEAMLRGENVFISGKAGTGKSLIIREFIKRSRTGTALLAPTGIAAKNIHGSTIHRMFNLPTVKIYRDENMPQLFEKQLSIIRQIKTLIIDEISMTRVDLFELIMNILRLYRDGNLPQCILIGDFLQLPPVITDNNVADYLNTQFGGPYVFDSPTFRSLEFRYIKLKKSYRQNDNEFIDILDHIRTGETLLHYQKPFTNNWFKNDYIMMDMYYDYIDLANQKLYKPVIQMSPGTTYLCATNRIADVINNNAIQQIQSKEYHYKGIVQGNYPDHLLPTSKYLRVKIGMKVMIVANGVDLVTGNHYVNGDIGFVINCTEDSVRVQLLDKSIINLKYNCWENMDIEYNINSSGDLELRDYVAGTFFQIPISCSYALTVHRAQGQTISDVCVNLGDKPMFAHGQLYTALSRAKSFEKLRIDRKLISEDIIVSERALRFENMIL